MTVGAFLRPQPTAVGSNAKRAFGQAVAGQSRLALEHFHEHRDELAVVFAARLGVGEDTLRPHVLAAAAATTAWTVIDRWVAEGSSADRLLPMLDEAFGMLSAALDAQFVEPSTR